MVAAAHPLAADWGIDILSAIELPNFGSRNGPTLIELGSRYEKLAPDLAQLGHQVEQIPLMSGLHGIERVAGGGAAGPTPGAMAWPGGANRLRPVSHR